MKKLETLKPQKACQCVSKSSEPLQRNGSQRFGGCVSSVSVACQCVSVFSK